MISSTFRNLVVRSAVVFTMLASTPVFAWDGAVSGTINTVEVTAGHNFGFRISLVGVGTMCTGGGAIAYLNESDSNYKVYVAALFSASAGQQRDGLLQSRERPLPHWAHRNLGLKHSDCSTLTIGTDYAPRARF